MGRLDDIVQRNQRALKGDGLAVKVVGKALGDDKPSEPNQAFTLPSQRRSGTAAWKVLVLMAVLGTAIGWYSCRQVQRDEQIDRERGLRP